MSRDDVKAIGWGCGALVTLTAMVWTVGRIMHGPGTFGETVARGAYGALMSFAALAALAEIGVVVWLIGCVIREAIGDDR